MVEYGALGGTQTKRQHTARIADENHTFIVAFANDARARFAVCKRRDDADDLVERSSGDIEATADFVSRHARLAGGIECLHNVDGAREPLFAGELTHGHERSLSFR